MTKPPNIFKRSPRIGGPKVDSKKTTLHSKTGKRNFLVSFMGGKCEACSTTANLQFAHLCDTPRSGGDTPPRMVRDYIGCFALLCSRCHADLDNTFNMKNHSRVVHALGLLDSPYLTPPFEKTFEETERLKRRIQRHNESEL